jgi:four helix bundle protein
MLVEREKLSPRGSALPASNPLNLIQKGFPMNNPKNDLTSRTYEFGKQCVLFAIGLPRDMTGTKHFAGQLIRCGTSTAANYRAAFIAPSRKAFSAKLSICAEEANETTYWLQLIKDLKYPVTDKLLSEHLETLLDESIQLTKIFVASRKTLNETTP